MKEKIINLLFERTSGILLLSLLSGIINYLYKISKGEKWNSKFFIINNTLAIFVGYGVSLALPDNDIEKLIVMVSAFTARDILGMLENVVPKLIEKKLNDLNK